MPDPTNSTWRETLALWVGAWLFLKVSWISNNPMFIVEEPKP